jgi:hypothetical protein
VGDDVTEGSTNWSPVRVASLRTSSIRQVCVVPFHTFEWLYAARLSPFWLGEPTATAPLLLGFWARLLKNEKRPVMLIRRDYVRVLCDKLETIPCRIILD